MTRPVLAVLVLTLASCAQILGFEDPAAGPGPDPSTTTTGDGDGDNTGDTTGDGDGDTGPDFSCADQTIMEGVGSVTINTEAATDDVTMSCGDTMAVDRLIGWVASVSDYYVIDTFGSDFDTVLSVLDGCDGAELACNNNAAATPQSEIVLRFDQGEPAIFAIEGNARDRGDAVVNVARVQCPDLDLTGQQFPVTLSTLGAGDDFDVACDGQSTVGFEDRAYHFVVPEDGLWRFRATSDSFRPTIATFIGPRCGPPREGCNNAALGRLGADVTRRLEAGTIVGVIVDGTDGQGEFELDIRKIDGTCPDEPSVPAPDVEQTLPATRVVTPSCAPGNVIGPLGDRDVENPSKTYQFQFFSVPQGGRASCEFTVIGEGYAIAIIEGAACAGREVACSRVPFGDTTASVEFGASGPFPETPLTIVVSRLSERSDSTYNLEVGCQAVALAP